jgi:hypothetical protein
MLHFMPVDPLGHVASIPTVHFCEHTGWPIMSNVLVQTPLVHSVDVSLGVTHIAPKAPGLVLGASGAGFESPAQAPSRNKHARRSRCMRSTLHRIEGDSE